MRILVTGATGRVGRFVVADAVERGWDVRTLQRRCDQSAGVESVAGSVTNADLVRRAVDGVDVVCHLAALMPPNAHGDLFDCNVRGTFNVLEAIRAEERPPRLVHASTDAVYGTGFSQRAYDGPISEEMSRRPTNVYGVTKVMAEDLVQGYSDLFGIASTILRYCWVFGPGEILGLFDPASWDEFMSPSDRERFRGSSVVPVLRGESGVPFTDHVVDARDAAAAAILAAQADRTGCSVLNVCGPAAFRYDEIAPRVASMLGRETAEIDLPSFQPYSIDGGRALEELRFRPHHDIESMIEEALPAASRSGGA